MKHINTKYPQINNYDRRNITKIMHKPWFLSHRLPPWKKPVFISPLANKWNEQHQPTNIVYTSYSDQVENDSKDDIILIIQTIVEDVISSAAWSVIAKHHAGYLPTPRESKLIAASPHVYDDDEEVREELAILASEVLNNVEN